ncbi:MAG: Crp/Fnr family transcriptional regulator [Mucilaginibacter sp.]|nr:Crp/Fnr family transcriptional regulator [Mucilaginibacter sp.]MDB5140679.1 Crp/Fnr family transcriptional regulator [Mucilaginibacter sp.]
MNNPLISYLQLFRFIGVEDQQLIITLFESRIYKEGSCLFHSGSVCRERFFICKGVLKIAVQNEKGNEVTHFFLKENQFCTILNSFNKEVPAEESIQAACDTEVLAISKSKLLALYEKLPYLKDLIEQITQQALLDKIQIRNAYLGHDSATRYRLFMMRQPEIALRVPLSDVASYLGITPQSLSRIRKNIR